MADNDRPAALLLAIHPDILLPGEKETGPLTAFAQDTHPETIMSREFRLDDEVYAIGRDDSRCQIRIRSYRLDISRYHATIRRENRQYLLEDHSAHGTFLNGQKLHRQSHPLAPYDVIGLATAVEMLRFVEHKAVPTLPEPLSERETEVLLLIADGLSTKEMARRLAISENTVKSHVMKIMAKLNVANRIQAVNQARKLRLI